VADHAIALDSEDPAAAVREHAPAGVDRVVEVAFSANVDLDAAVAAEHAVIAAYGTQDPRPGFPFWPMLFANITVRLLGSDDFPAEAKRQAAQSLTAAAADGDLCVPIGEPFALERIAEAHERVEAGARERVLIALADGPASRPGGSAGR
jgi:NADPH2:quinone reductase